MFEYSSISTMFIIYLYDIILNNDYLAHGRSGFKLNNKGPQRSLLRIWIR